VAFRYASSSHDGRLPRRVAALIDNGAVISTLEHRVESINAENLEKAHVMLEQGSAYGKIVLENF